VAFATDPLESRVARNASSARTLPIIDLSPFSRS